MVVAERTVVRLRRFDGIWMESAEEYGCCRKVSSRENTLQSIGLQH